MRLRLRLRQRRRKFHSPSEFGFEEDKGDSNDVSEEEAQPPKKPQLSLDFDPDLFKHEVVDTVCKVLKEQS